MRFMSPHSNPVGTDNGKPGIRKDYGDKYYAACVKDPFGYRLEVYTEN
jgi:hypothetical protein